MDANCCEKGRLYFEYVNSTPECRNVNRAIYASHLRTCPICSRQLEADYDRARQAVHPAKVVEIKP
jgi:hypothetical protein